MEVVPKRGGVPDLTAEERIRNHRKDEAYAKGECQERQEGSHCSRGRLLGIPGQGHNPKRQGKEHDRMQEEPKRSRTSISGNPGEDVIHNAEGHRIRHQEEDQCRVEGEFHFQAGGERHLEYVGDFS